MSERSRRPVPVSAPPRVRDLLGQAPDGPVPVVHRGDRAVYVEIGGRCVGVVAPGAAEVPCALRAREPGDPGWWRGDAAVDSGVLHVAGSAFPVGRVVDVRVPALVPGARSDGTAAALLGRPPAALSGLGTEPPEAMDPPTVAGLVGRGDGLTPLGDDILCGWLATHRAAGAATTEVDVAVRARLHRTTLLSGTLLDCALHGEVLPGFGRYLAALGTAHEQTRAADLLRLGHSSGAGLLYGAALALAALDLAGRRAA